jgi:leucyl/phenylalanyl-tRNA---protein transferase
MPVFRLAKELIFPPPELADTDGLLGVGGDLSCDRLLLAYSMGIFPWYDRRPILWWSPNPRFILELEHLMVTKGLAKTLRKNDFDVSFDQAFKEVITACALTPRKSEPGTWITDEMLEAYCQLFEKGFAHSVECRRDGVLVGGLYGVSLGRCFFGESMFHKTTDASKVALAHLVDYLKNRDFELLDCQIPNDHLRSLGAGEISREEFLQRLRKGGVFPTASPPPSAFKNKPETRQHLR